MFFKIYQEIRMTIAQFRVWNRMIKRYERYAKGLDMEMVGKRTCPMCISHTGCNTCPLFKSKFCSEYYAKIEDAGKKKEIGLFRNWSRLAVDDLNRYCSKKERS